MSLFVLIHGAWHGAACWTRLVPELAARGHAAVAVDLPIETSVGLDAWLETILGACPPDEDDIVLVGHSLGARALAHVALARPVRHLVYLSAVFPDLARRGAPREEQPARSPANWAEGQIAHADGSTSWDPRIAVEVFYNACEPAVAARAASQLRRHDFSALDTSLDRWPPTPVSAIHGDDDLALLPPYLRWGARNILGVEPTEIAGDHSLMLSRPAELADLLAAV
jgi:pimeloyl-ACP methyl ester carboxylesterase